MTTLLLRGFSVAFLSWHGGMLFPGLAEPAVLAATGVAALLGGAWARTLRSAIALPLGALVYVLLRIAVNEIPLWFIGSQPSALDLTILWTERQSTFAILPFALGWFNGWAFTSRPDRRGLERLIHAALIVALFWSQGAYHVTLYPHPLELALVFAPFLVVELFLLAGRPPHFASWAAGLLVIALGVSLLWSLLGRYEDQSTASGGGLMKPDLFQFDFAPLVRLESEIQLGKNLVLLYREEGPPRPRYLRRMVLDNYDPAQGFSSATGRGLSLGRKPQQFPPATALQDRVPVRQEYYLVNLDPSSLLTLNEPTLATPYAQWNRSSFVNAYRVESMVAGNSLWEYNEIDSDGLTQVQRDFLTRGGDDEEIRALARTMMGGAKTLYEKVTAIELALREGYLYSLRPGPAGPRGALKHFLFENKKGYCSYFAFSMVLLLRSQGIPARIAVGFASDPSTAVLGFQPIRAYQAHAWVEVPFGPVGWLEFDPTSPNLAPGEAFELPRGMDPEELSRMIAEILAAAPQPLDEQLGDQPADAARISWERIWTSSLALAPWILAGLLLLLNEGLRHRWRWARLWARDPRRRATLLWTELVHHARRANLGPSAGETPEAWACRLDHPQIPDLSPLAQTVSRVRYSASLPRELLPALEKQVQTFVRCFDSTRPPVHRLMSSLLPWWPR